MNLPGRFSPVVLSSPPVSAFDESLTVLAVPRRRHLTTSCATTYESIESLHDAADSGHPPGPVYALMSFGVTKQGAIATQESFHREEVCHDNQESAGRRK